MFEMLSLLHTSDSEEEEEDEQEDELEEEEEDVPHSQPTLPTSLMSVMSFSTQHTFSR